jgi:hypothetical protein
LIAMPTLTHSSRVRFGGMKAKADRISSGVMGLLGFKFVLDGLMASRGGSFRLGSLDLFGYPCVDGGFGPRREPARKLDGRRHGPALDGGIDGGPAPAGAMHDFWEAK